MASHSNVKVFDLDDPTKRPLGMVRVKGDITYSTVRKEILEDAVFVESFDFVEDDCLLNMMQEEKWVVESGMVHIKRKASTHDLNTVRSKESCIGSNDMRKEKEQQCMDTTFPHVGIEKEVVLISGEILQQWELACERVRIKLQNLHVPRDDSFELKVEELQGKHIIRVWCNECGEPYGSGSVEGKFVAYNCLSNFLRSHIYRKKHEKMYHARRGSNNAFVEQCKGINEDHANVIISALEVMENFNASTPGASFELINATLHDYKNKSLVRIRCKCDDAWLPLCPPRSDLLTIMQQHLLAKSHEKASHKSKEPMIPALTGNPGRPRNVHQLDSNQQSLSKYLVSTKTSESHGPSSPSNEQCEFNASSLSLRVSTDPLVMLCWGFWSETITIGDEIVNVKPLLLDHNHGVEWFCEPHTRGIIVDGLKSYTIEGCFRHSSCLRLSRSEEPFSNFTCSFCNIIPKCDDFRMRLYRERHSEIKRGERGTGDGRRLDYLTKDEIQKAITDSKRKVRDVTRSLWWARSRISLLSVRVRSLREASIESLNRKDIRRFCNNIIEAHRIGKFGGKVSLWEFLQDIARNLVRERQGHRYKETSKGIFELVKMWGGPRLHDFLSENLYGPSMSTTKRQGKRAIQFCPGIHEYIFNDVAKIYAKEKERHGIYSRIPFIIVEDETVIKRNIRWNARDDTLIGFCGLKSENHQCIASCVIKVGEASKGYDIIVDAFQSYVIGHYGRVLIANPLHEKLPRLALVVHGTCNRFDANFVKMQWKEIQKLWKKNLATDIGPIIGHASDGDSRRRKLMMEDYMGKEGERYEIGWCGWDFSARIIDDDIFGIHDQDFIHNGKKLVNAIDNASRELAIGDVWITFNHVVLVYNLFSFDAHGLRDGDIARDDRQNWAAAQRVASRHVQSCLEELHKGKELVHRKERSAHGTEAYLQITADYIDIFLSPHLGLRDRVVLAAKVAFFFNIWKLWIHHHPTYTLKKNFISRETFTDVQISCHFVVLLIKMFRDFYPYLECPLYLTGSDAAEIFFSKMGGMIGMERAFDLSDLLHCTGNLNKLARFECNDSGLVFSRAHKKQECIWDKLNRQDALSNANLRDYEDVNTDEKIINALKEGLQLAQDLCESLKMKPKDLIGLEWWFCPWVNDSPILSGVEEDVENEEDNIDIESFVSTQISNNNNEDDDDNIAVSELRHELDAILGGIRSDDEKICATIELDNKLIFKSTLISQLNGNPTLSKDRLTRVKEGVYFTQDDKNRFMANGNLFGIGSDCAVYFVEDRDVDTSKRKFVAKKSVTKEKNKSECWYLGRVQRMRRKTGGRTTEYRRGIDLMDRPEGLEVQLGWYTKAKGTRMFTYDLTDLQMIDIESIIALANLYYDSSQDKYKLDENDYKVFNDFIKER